MPKVIDGTKVPSHGLFYMEDAGGLESVPPPPAADEHQPSCFAWEEERGDGWHGAGATKSPVNEARPRL